MTMGGSESQPVRLIAVDSEGIPVTDPQILQAAAEQAGIMFVSKDENDEENSITIDQAMQVKGGHLSFFVSQKLDMHLYTCYMYYTW